MKKSEPVEVTEDVIAEGPTEKWGSDAESVYDEDTDSYYEEQNDLNERDRKEFQRLGFEFDGSTVECIEKSDDDLSAHAFKYPLDSVSYNASRTATIDSSRMPSAIITDKQLLPPRPSTAHTLHNNRTMSASQQPNHDLLHLRASDVESYDNHLHPARSSATPTMQINRNTHAVESYDNHSHPTRASATPTMQINRNTHAVESYDNHSHPSMYIRVLY